MGEYTNNYQAIAGQRALLSEDYTMTSPTILMGVTATPAYGGEPSTVSVNIISQKKVLNLIGQQDTETFKVDFIPDWTATTGNYDIIKSKIGQEMWFYEELLPSDSETSETIQDGILTKIKIRSISRGGAQANNAPSCSFYADITSASQYLCRRVKGEGSTETVTYSDFFTGASVTTPV